MVRAALFGEDSAHSQIITPLVNRIASEQRIALELEWISAVRGHGRVAQALHDYLRDLGNQDGLYPELIIVATDANCQGLNRRTREFRDLQIPTNLVLAIPDPHIERWLLLDGSAFREVYGRGCSAPDQKCDRDRYKQLLTQAIYEAGRQPILGGLERASDMIQAMDIERASRADESFDRFVTDMRRSLLQIQS